MNPAFKRIYWPCDANFLGPRDGGFGRRGRIPTSHRDFPGIRPQGRGPANGPFLAGQQGQATGDVALSGILWDAAHPLAIMNGAPVSVGDAVDGFQVLDIAPDHVTLSDGTTTYDVRLAP